MRSLYSLHYVCMPQRRQRCTAQKNEKWNLPKSDYYCKFSNYVLRPLTERNVFSLLLVLTAFQQCTIYRWSARCLRSIIFPTSYIASVISCRKHIFFHWRSKVSTMSLHSKRHKGENADFWAFICTWDFALSFPWRQMDLPLKRLFYIRFLWITDVVFNFT